MLDLQERLIEASLADEIRPALRKADVSLTKLCFYLRLCRDLGLISLGQYEHVGRMVAEIGRLLGGWTKKVLAGAG